MQHNSNGGQSVISDSVTLASIRNFIADENKPNDSQPIDILLTVVAMLRKAEEHPLTESQQTLARRLGCSVKTIARSQARLAQNQYVSRIRRKGRTSELMLNAENIPAEAPLRLRLTEDASSLALWYKSLLTRNGRKRFPKHFLSQQHVTAQRILNFCDTDLNQAKSIIAFALGSRHAKKSFQSLYNLYGRWEMILSDYHAQNGNGEVSESLGECARNAETSSGIDAITDAAKVADGAPTTNDGCEFVSVFKPYGPVEDGRWQDGAGNLLSVSAGREALASCGLEQFGRQFCSAESGQMLPEILALGVMASGTRYNAHRRAA